MRGWRTPGHPPIHTDQHIPVVCEDGEPQVILQEVLVEIFRYLGGREDGEDFPVQLPWGLGINTKLSAIKIIE